MVATIVCDGRNFTVKNYEGGYWVGPTLIDDVLADMSVYQEEVFGPVLCVVRVESYDEALEFINKSRFGNGTAIFTRDGGIARHFSQYVQVGMVGINVPIPVPVSYHSFGGWKNSLFGDQHMYGMEGVRFFTKQKLITSRWLDSSNVLGPEFSMPVMN